jgi:hypothetical protein
MQHHHLGRTAIVPGDAEGPWRMHGEALAVLPRVLDLIGSSRGMLIGASDDAPIATLHMPGRGDLDDGHRPFDPPGRRRSATYYPAAGFATEILG